MSNIFVTSNRRLENILFYLGVTAMSWGKNEDGMTEWTYHNTEKVQQIVKWFRENIKNRERMGW